MGLLERARQDWRRHISGEEGFGVDITFYNLPSPEVVIRGLGMAHHLGQDTEGNVVSSRNSHITFSESLANEKGIVTRNQNGEVNIDRAKVSFVDSAGIKRFYVIKQSFPDETAGLIYCVLATYE